jgi:histidine ammonia-lyase
MTDGLGLVALGLEPLTLEDYEAVVYAKAGVRVADAGRVGAHRAALLARLAEGEVIYSVNTGYGEESSRAIDADRLGRVQQNTLASHAAGLGRPVAPAVTRGMMLLVAQAAAQGPPAISPGVLEAYVRALNEDRRPVVPSLGTHSASDLVPGAHVALDLLAGIQLGPKDGGVINNSAFSTALAVDALRQAERRVDRAEAVAALTLEAVRGFPGAFSERLVALRPHPGALVAAAHIRDRLAGSERLSGPGRPHDPFSLRCLPQVHGAIRGSLGQLRAAVRIEVAAVTDNPVVFADGEVISGGNFHGAPLGLPLDGASLALGELATLSAARTRQLVGGGLGTPPRLTREPGERLGMLMLPGVAAALVAEARQRGAAASRESIPVDLMEDHVSMSGLAARQTLEVAHLSGLVVAIELACAAQALDLTADRGRTSTAGRELHAAVRERVGVLEDDRPLDASLLLDLV